MAAGIVQGDAIVPLPCADGAEDAAREKIAARYFAQGAVFDLYVRGAPSGSFVLAAEDEPTRGCSNRARGSKVGSPGRVTTFIALDPEDPVKLSTLRFPSGIQAGARDVVNAILQAEPFSISPVDTGIHEVRRLQDGTASVLVTEVSVPTGRIVLVAEGTGSDPAVWKRVWSSETDQTTLLVDAFDLGADGTTELLLERIHRGEPSEWILLRRDEAGNWAPVKPGT